MMALGKTLAFACFGLAIVGASQPDQPVALMCAVEVAPSDSGSGRIGAVAIGTEGRLAWTDGRPGQVMVRDGRGQIRAVGRTGAGPGEFRSASTLGWWGDTMWVGDVSVPRVQFFSDTGAYRDGITAVIPASWAPRPGGRLVGFARRRISADGPEVLLEQSAQQRLDTVASWPLVPAPRMRLANGPPRGNPQPFAPETVVGASPDHSRFCGARPAGAGWQIECVDDASTLLSRRVHTLAGFPLTDALYDSAVERLSNLRDQSEVRRALTRPKTLPAINGLKVADNGDVWLQRTDPTDRMGIWQRITRDGREEREISVAPLTRVLLFTADSVWGARADADGLESLLRCAVPSQ